CRHEQIIVTVVVVIPYRDAQRVSFNRETDRPSNVCKRSVVVVVKHLQRRRASMLPRPVFTVREEQVLPTVSVVVNEGDTWTESLWKIFFAKRAVVVAEGDA